MLPAQYRLRRNADIRRVRRQGRRQHHPLLSSFVRPNQQDVSRFAIAVSRRVGSAVERNRCKRRVREAIRHHLQEVEAGWDCLFVVHDTTPAASYTEIEEAVLQLLREADLLNLSA